MAITNIYKGVLERSDINKIYKGTTLLYEKVVPQGETWVINESIDIATEINEIVNFVSSGINYTSISGFFHPRFGYNLEYGHQEGIQTVFIDNWVSQDYRTVTFETSPTGALLTWLQANAVKQ